LRYVVAVSPCSHVSGI